MRYVYNIIQTTETVIWLKSTYAFLISDLIGTVVSAMSTILMDVSSPPVTLSIFSGADWCSPVEQIG